MADLPKRWQVKPKITPAAAQELGGYHPILAQLLFNRQIDSAREAEAFIAAHPRHSSDPFGLQDMSAAVERIARAVANGEHIAIYGDYDVDGITSTVLMVQLLESYGAQVTPYIPHRFDEGYGLNIEALDSLSAKGVALVVTVDCGIRALEEVAHARRIGLDLIVSDHHHVGPELPPAVAVINPKRFDDTYPEKMLAGVGLAYKLAQALVATLPSVDGLAAENWLDLVALGTVADLAPLLGENRILVRDGLRVLNATRREGLRSLMRIARLPEGALRAVNIGFQLGPRLNAAGRISEAWAAYNLLITNNEERAERLADCLESHNRKRRELTQTITDEARAIALAERDEYLLFAAHESFNAGVVGLAASRLSEEYYRPAFVAEVRPDAGVSVGSARSIPEFNVSEVLDECSDLLVRYGGHAAAAGFTVTNENRPLLAERLRAAAADRLDGKDLRPTVSIDMEVPLRDLSFEVMSMLSKLEPCGYGNRIPVFVSRDVRVLSHRTVGREGKHLKFNVRAPDSASLEAIAFGYGDWAARMPAVIDVVYELEINEWQGRRSLQLNVKDLRPSI
ncbi:MAG: single-stranded-DNA-specific exonuclease RecJ [Anaerolineales bacterium]